MPLTQRQGLGSMRVFCARPLHLFSRSFELVGEGHRAEIRFAWFGERGSLTIDGDEYSVHKHGVFSGHWTLVRARKTVVSAKKPSAFLRKFLLEGSSGRLSLCAEGVFRRRYAIERSGMLLGRIAARSLLSRERQIELLTSDVDFPTLCFACWLVLMLKRRDRKRD